jgi:DNA-directed RNA polymerase subunit RPC12/RpoP
VPPVRTVVPRDRRQPPTARARLDARGLPRGVPADEGGAHGRRRCERSAGGAHPAPRSGRRAARALHPEWRARRDTAAHYRVQRWRSLAVLRPDLAGELHPTRNGDLDPYAVATTSSRRVWWRCARCRHEWEASVSARARGDGCRACAKRAQIGRRLRVRPGQSLAELRPDLAAELHPTRNGDLDPYAVARWSVLPVWWRCARCGHDWEASPKNRTGCPWCAAHRVPSERSLAVLCPDLAAELHPSRNGDLDPYAIGASSSLKLWKAL